MGKVAEDYSCMTIITDDNPRHEDGNEIVGDILKGFKAPQRVTVIRNRAEAIAYAIDYAPPDALIVIAGKGHEKYQEKNGIRTVFNDVDRARYELLKRKEK
jgi:UDP-N-acetylmuramoyl-L-alanyl-D-glutamate--2,6-diaminopimelate ligase